MTEQTLESFFARQREKYEKQRQDARALLAEAETELRALDAYEQAKKGTPSPQGEGGRKTSKSREVGKRAEILSLVRQYPDGVTVGELKDKLGIRRDKKAENSLTNALSAIKRQGHIRLEEGVYTAAAPQEGDATPGHGA